MILAAFFWTSHGYYRIVKFGTGRLTEKVQGAWSHSLVSNPFTRKLCPDIPYPETILGLSAGCYIQQEMVRFPPKSILGLNQHHNHCPYQESTTST